MITKNPARYKLIPLIPFLASVLSTSMPAGAVEPVVTRPAGVTPRSSAEFYSSNPRERVLIPVNIWGEVKEPGIHFVPVGANVLQTVSAAGGPTNSADLPKISLVRADGARQTLDLYKAGAITPIGPNDTLMVDYNLARVNLPLIFGGITAAVSVATLLVVVLRK